MKKNKNTTKNKNSFNDFKQYHSLLMLGFIGGIITWIFSFTFEHLNNQITKFWALFVISFFVSFIWYILFSTLLFSFLKLLGFKFDK